MEEEIKKLEWSPGYEVDIQIIDENHKNFVELVNRFVDLLNNQSCMRDHTDIFYSLIHYAEHYLIREEILFKELGYPNLAQHKENHSRFFGKIKYFQEKYALEDPGICKEMYAFLISWFNDHILQYDVETAKFLKEKGIS